MALLAGYLGWALLGATGLTAAVIVVLVFLAFAPRISPRMMLRLAVMPNGRLIRLTAAPEDVAS